MLVLPLATTDANNTTLLLLLVVAVVVLLTPSRLDRGKWSRLNVNKCLSNSERFVNSNVGNIQNNDGAPQLIS